MEAFQGVFLTMIMLLVVLEVMLTLHMLILFLGEEEKMAIIYNLKVAVAVAAQDLIMRLVLSQVKAQQVAQDIILIINQEMVEMVVLLPMLMDIMVLYMVVAAVALFQLQKIIPAVLVPKVSFGLLTQ